MLTDNKVSSRPLSSRTPCAPGDQSENCHLRMASRRSMALAIPVWACATAIAGIGAWLSVVFELQSLCDDRTQADRDFQEVVDEAQRRTSPRRYRRPDRLAYGLAGSASPVGLGISELRIHYGPGYCVYFQKRGSTIIVLPCGGDKSMQAKDIKAAKRLADEWSE